MDKNENAIKQLQEGIMSYVKMTVDESPYDRTFSALITDVEDSQKHLYTIQMNGSTYKGISSIGGEYTKGEIVRVIVPQNNFNKMYIETFNLQSTAISQNNLSSNVANIDTLNADDAFIKNIYSDKILSDSVITNTLQSNIITTDYLKASSANLDWAKILNATIDNTMIKNATIDYAKINNAFVSDLTSDTIFTENLKATIGNFGYLTANSAEIEKLEANDANINTLIFGSASGQSMTSEFANSVVSIVNEAIITDAMIKDLSASKISTGSINTNNVQIISNGGKLLISDNTIQIKDNSSIVRVQIGEGTDGDYNLILTDKDGNTMWDATGLQALGVKSKIIKDNMVADDANIKGSKLDIENLFDTMNNSEYALQSNKIYLDNDKNTLDVSFKTLATQVDTIQKQVDGAVYVYSDLTEEPTLESYPSNLFCEHNYPSDNLYPSENLNFSIYSDEIYHKYLGTKAFMKDGSNGWTFVLNDDGTYGWSLITGTLDAQFSSRISLLEVSSEKFKSDLSEVQTTVNSQGIEINSMNSSIEQNSNNIKLCVTQTTYNNGMEGKNLISQINQTAEEIKISADKLTLDGLVTVKGLENGTTSIDGNCINTGAIKMTMNNSKTPFISISGESYINELSPSSLSMYFRDEGYESATFDKFLSDLSPRFGLSLKRYNYGGGANEIRITCEGFELWNRSGEQNKRVAYLNSDGYAKFNSISIIGMPRWANVGIKEWFKTSRQVPTAMDVHDYLYALGLI